MQLERFTDEYFGLPMFTTICSSQMCVSVVACTQISLLKFSVVLSDRYRIEYEALSKVEAEQNEFIDQFMLQK